MSGGVWKTGGIAEDLYEVLLRNKQKIIKQKKLKNSYLRCIVHSRYYLLITLCNISSCPLLIDLHI